jgi:hypothetical protein
MHAGMKAATRVRNFANSTEWSASRPGHLRLLKASIVPIVQAEYRTPACSPVATASELFQLSVYGSTAFL